MANFFGQSWDDPQTLMVMNMARGLLEGNPQGQGRATFGHGIARGIQGGLEGHVMAQQMRGQREQMDMAKQEMEMKRAKQDELSKLMASVSSPQGGAPGGLGLTLPQAAALKMGGGPDMLSYVQEANNPKKLEQGATYLMPNGQERHMPTMAQGMTVVDGHAQMVPGYGAANAAIQGQQAQATERARADNDLVEIANPDGSRSMVSRSAVLGNNGALSQRAPSQTTYETENAKRASENYAKYRTAGDAAGQRIQQLNGIEALLGDYDGNKYTPLGMEIGKAAQSLGVNIDSKLGNKEAAAFITNQMVQNFMSEVGGVISDADMAHFRTLSPNVMQSADGRKMITGALRKAAERQQFMGSAAEKWNNAYGNIDAPDERGRTFGQMSKAYFGSQSIWTN